MFSRRSLHLAITLAILMIVSLVALIVGWVLLTTFGLQHSKATVLYVTLLSVGTTCLVLVLVGTVVYLYLSVKAINLTRRQSNFMDSVTHELKSPIASLKLYLQTLSRRTVDEAQRENFYGYMLDDVERLDHLINHILHAASLERETKDRSARPVDLRALLTESAQAVRLRYRLPTESVQCDLQPCWVAANQVDMDLIFRNLLDNAAKYAGDPPQIRIELKNLPSGRARVNITDNGPGIPRKLRRKIFTRFVRLGSELERKRPGTGLGLYIVRTLVERWKGRVQVRDRGSETGTVFDVELAAAQSVPPNLSRQAGSRNPTDNLGQVDAHRVTAES